MNHDFIISVINVLVVMVLNPYFFSITNVSYQLKGILIISEASPIIIKKMRAMITRFELILLARSSASEKPPATIIISITARLMEEDQNASFTLSLS